MGFQQLSELAARLPDRRGHSPSVRPRLRCRGAWLHGAARLAGLYGQAGSQGTSLLCESAQHGLFNPSARDGCRGGRWRRQGSRHLRPCGRSGVPSDPLRSRFFHLRDAQRGRVALGARVADRHRAARTAARHPSFDRADTLGRQPCRNAGRGVLSLDISFNWHDASFLR